jgi:hypothetical protein
MAGSSQSAFKIHKCYIIAAIQIDDVLWETATYHIELFIFLEHIYLRHLHFGETFFYEINIFL